MAESHHTSRRAILKAAPLAAFAALPSPALAADTPVMSPFREWKDGFLRFERMSGLTDGESDSICRAQSEIVNRMVDVPSADFRDVTAKIVAFTFNGQDFAYDDRGTGEAILTEARTMIGGAA